MPVPSSESREQAGITSAEWRLMEVLWAHGPLKMAVLVEHLAPSTGWNRTTVLTLAGRLERKGYLATDRSERAFTYIPMITPKQAKRERLRRLVDEVFAGKAYNLLRFLCDDHLITKEDLMKAEERLNRPHKKRARAARAENAKTDKEKKGKKKGKK